MGICVSAVKKDKANKLHGEISSPEKDKSTVAGDIPITGVGLSSHRWPLQGVASVRDHDSKEETFFDSQPWLNSDSEDDFLSVNGDFTPSRGSTPLHPSFSPKIPSLNQSLIDGKPTIFKSEQSPAEKKRSLVELFRDSIRISYHPDTDEQNVLSDKNGTVTNEDFQTKEKHEKYLQCCMPRMLSSRRSIGGNKKICPPPTNEHCFRQRHLCIL